MSSPRPEGVAGCAALLPLFRDLVDLKRIRVAGRNGSVAERLFLEAWARLAAGQSLPQVAREITARALIATRLAGVDIAVLLAGGLSPEEARSALCCGFNAAATPLAGALAEELRATVGSAKHLLPAPEFARRLAQQPRAGATRPGHGRVVLEPAENHAEHCLAVAVGGVLAAPLYGAALEEPFLTGLAHHLHNAGLPDAGDAGDHLLHAVLPRLQETFRKQALAELVPELQLAVQEALRHVYSAEAPAARAFQTADVLDRVLEMEWHARSASFTLSVALEQMDIVHPGPVQAFQLEIMRATRLHT